MRSISRLWRILWTGLSIAVFAVSCAHQVMPSGGPIDKTPPQVKSALPEQGDVGWDRNQEVVVRFSEWIDPTSAAKSVTIFPPLDKGIQTVVRGAELRIKPLSPFADSTTYHLEINATLKDLHGISIGTPFHRVFSTGPALDSGAVSGCVVDPPGAAGQPKIGLYRCLSDTTPDSLILGMPSYLVQTDSAGKFTLEHIRPGIYEIIGFADRNNDNRLQPGEGDVFAPQQRRAAISKSRLNIELYPSSCDTAARTIVSAIAVSPSTVIAQWSKAPDENTAPDASVWRVETADSAARPLAISRVVPIARSNRYALMLADQLRRTGYRLICPRLRPMRSALVNDGRDTVRFNGVSSPDTIRPKITVRRPAGETALQPRIAIAFSEAVRLRTGGVWMLRDSLSGDSVAVDGDTLWSDTAVFKPRRRLALGTAYRLRFPLSAFEDFAGNHPMPLDSADSFSVSFRTVSGDEMCMSMAGRAACPNVALGEKRWWIFSAFFADRADLAVDSAGAFRFDSLPAAKGRLTLFVDRNGDGVPTAGSLFPWRPAEPFILFADTIEARARWDVSGITLTGCDPCARIVKTTPAGSPPARPSASERPRDHSFQRPTIPIGQ